MGFWSPLVRLSRATHSYLTMFGLLSMSFFAVTGLMLNHPKWCGLDRPQFVALSGSLPPGIVAPADRDAIVQALRTEYGATGKLDAFELDEEQIVAVLVEPGRRTEATINVPDATVEVVTETRGAAGRLTDLHRNQSAGPWWRLFIDATAVVLLLAVITGVVVLLSLPKRRLLGAVCLVVGIAVWGGAYMLLVCR